MKQPSPCAVRATEKICDTLRYAENVDERKEEIAAIVDDESNRWEIPESAPKDRTRVLAAYVGVYEPTTGAIADCRFYPDGCSGSQPFTHWMPLPSVANQALSTPVTHEPS
jgi:hypothetical protein